MSSSVTKTIVKQKTNKLVPKPMPKAKKPKLVPPTKPVEELKVLVTDSRTGSEPDNHLWTVGADAPAPLLAALRTGKMWFDYVYFCDGPDATDGLIQEPDDEDDDEADEDGEPAIEELEAWIDSYTTPRQHLARDQLPCFFDCYITLADV